MNLIVFVVTILGVATATPVSNLLAKEWRIFKVQHGKTYENRVEEEYRMQVYLNNSRIIDEHNKRYAAGEVSFELGMNQFGDLLHHEFEQMMLTKNYETTREKIEGKSCDEQTPYDTSNMTLSDNWNWVEKGAVTPVKNQGQCGSCWAFSAVATLESHHFLKYGKLVNLSEQNLIDCSRNFSNNGCGGGLSHQAFLYVIDQQGIDTEESYPYQQRDNETCHYDPAKSAEKITGCRLLPRNDEEQLKIAVEKEGPISVSMYASSCEFQFYKSGVFYSTLCKSDIGNVNHQLLMVGFGSENGQDYWLVKNSWGLTWGDGGYFKIARNAGSHCAIASYSSFPVTITPS